MNHGRSLLLLLQRYWRLVPSRPWPTTTARFSPETIRLAISFSPETKLPGKSRLSSRMTMTTPMTEATLRSPSRARTPTQMTEAPWSPKTVRTPMTTPKRAETRPENQ
jgi:hypothetical protein